MCSIPQDTQNNKKKSDHIERNKSSANENIDRIFQGQKAVPYFQGLSLFFLFFRDKYGSSGTVGISVK